MEYFYIFVNQKQELLRNYNRIGLFREQKNSVCTAIPQK